MLFLPQRRISRTHYKVATSSLTTTHQKCLFLLFILHKIEGQDKATTLKKKKFKKNQVTISTFLPFSYFGTIQLQCSYNSLTQTTAQLFSEDSKQQALLYIPCALKPMSYFKENLGQLEG